jgi:NAD(P)-dependent dehydrogenase (short-subunit alcohol dehydrogenase family)
VAAQKLEGRRVLITGASSGVGYAAAGAYARAGADVALLARGEEGLEKAAAEVRLAGRRAAVCPADVTEPEALHEAVRRAKAELGGLDVLVLNHAAVAFGPFDQMPAEDFDRVVEITLLGSVNVVREVLPELERTGGTIVATGSLNAKLPLPTFSPYAAAKHGLRGFLNSLRVELAAQRSPVEISIVHPGAIDTPVWDTAHSVTGHAPRKPPEGYSPETIAGALVACTVRPRKEVTVGAEARALEALFTYARPFGELFWTAVHHYYMTGRRPMSDAGALWKASGRGISDAKHMLGRPSVWAPVRLMTWPLRIR